VGLRQQKRLNNALVIAPNVLTEVFGWMWLARLLVELVKRFSELLMLSPAMPSWSRMPWCFKCALRRLMNAWKIPFAKPTQASNPDQGYLMMEDCFGIQLQPLRTSLAQASHGSSVAKRVIPTKI
jgi:hypothetical protein